MVGTGLLLLLGGGSAIVVVKNRLWTGWFSVGSSLAGDRHVRWHPSEGEWTTASDLLHPKLWGFHSFHFSSRFPLGH